jgi:hypothetical protein
VVGGHRLLPFVVGDVVSPLPSDRREDHRQGAGDGVA